MKPILCHPALHWCHMRPDRLPEPSGNYQRHKGNQIQKTDLVCQRTTRISKSISAENRLLCSWWSPRKRQHSSCLLAVSSTAHLARKQSYCNPILLAARSQINLINSRPKKNDNGSGKSLQFQSQSSYPENRFRFWSRTMAGSSSTQSDELFP